MITGSHVNNNTIVVENVRIVVFAWGKKYANRLLARALAAASAPGNIPHLAKHYNCTLAIVTESKLFAYFEKRKEIIYLSKFCKIEFVSLDNLITEPWQYGMTLSKALFRGFAELGNAMTDCYVLFLNADFILADGSYKNLIPYLQSNHNAIFAPSYPTIEEYILENLNKNSLEHEGIISFAHRELAKLILGNLHNTVKAKIINQDKIHAQYTDQFYWSFDSETLLGYQMPVALVALRPEVIVTEINTFWDWGAIYEFCPSKKLTVIGDSDEFLMLELREEKTSIEQILIGSGNPKLKASAIARYITDYQLDFARFPLTLHVNDISETIENNRKLLTQEMNKILNEIPTKYHEKNHRVWQYHLEHLDHWQKTEKNRNRIAKLKKIQKNIEKRDRNFAQNKIRAMIENETGKIDFYRNEIIEYYGYDLIDLPIIYRTIRLASRKFIWMFKNNINSSPFSIYNMFFHGLKNLKKEYNLFHQNNVILYDANGKLARPINIIKKDNIFTRINDISNFLKINQFTKLINNSKSNQIIFLINIDLNELKYIGRIINQTRKISPANSLVVFHVLIGENSNGNIASNILARIILSDATVIATEVFNPGISWKILFKLISYINSISYKNRFTRIFSSSTILALAPVSATLNLYEKYRFIKNKDLVNITNTYAITILVKP